MRAYEVSVNNSWNTCSIMPGGIGVGARLGSLAHPPIGRAAALKITITKHGFRFKHMCPSAHDILFELLTIKRYLVSNGLRFLRELDETIEVAIETTPGWYWIYDCLEGEGFKVKLSHQLKTGAIAYAKVKTDKTRGYWRPRGDSNP